MESQEYYSDSTNWGSGQYMSLKEIVENYMIDLEPDDPTFNVGRGKVLSKARQAIKEFNFSSVKNYNSIELALSSTLQVPLPQDFVDYYQISWVDEQGKKYPMTINDRLSIAKSPLQDNTYAFIYDATGEIIYASGTRPDYNVVEDYYSNKNVDLGQMHENGSFNVNKEEGVIQFDSNAYEKTIILDYITDGYTNIDDANIKIHKFAYDACSNYIFYYLIKRRKNIAQSEKLRAQKDLNVSVRKMNSRMHPVRLEDVLQTLRTKSRWIKQV